MKLAEALSIRSDLQKRIDQIGPRLDAVCRVQEGDKPAESAESIFKELRECLAKVEILAININKTNQLTTLSDGMTLTQKIAHRDMLRKHCQILQNLLNTLTQRQDRYTRSEIKYVNTVNVPDLRKEADRLSKELRITDMQIQEANWTVELLE